MQLLELVIFEFVPNHFMLKTWKPYTMSRSGNCKSWGSGSDFQLCAAVCREALVGFCCSSRVWVKWWIWWIEWGQKKGTGIHRNVFERVENPSNMKQPGTTVWRNVLAQSISLHSSSAVGAMGLWGRQEIANAQLGRLHFGRWGPIESAQLVVRPGRVFEGIMESWSLDFLNGHHQSFRMLPIVFS